jgi:hypothetical protein
MSGSSKDFETTRVQTSLGVFVVVSHSSGVRAGQTFSQEASQGKLEWHAQCADWYGPGIPPIQCRVPERGGYASLEELERAMVEEVMASLQTDYWRDR